MSNSGPLDSGLVLWGLLESESHAVRRPRKSRAIRTPAQRKPPFTKGWGSHNFADEFAIGGMGTTEDVFMASFPVINMAGFVYRATFYLKQRKRRVTLVDPHLQRLQETIQAVMTGLSEEQRNWHPPGKWCAADVLEHLYLTYTGTIKGFERVIAAGKPNARSQTLTDRGRAFVVVGLGHLPAGREAPPTARPKGLPRSATRSRGAESG